MFKSVEPRCASPKHALHAPIVIHISLATSHMNVYMFVLLLCTLTVTPPDTTPETNPTHCPDAKLSNHPMAGSGDQGEN